MDFRFGLRSSEDMTFTLIANQLSVLQRIFDIPHPPQCKTSDVHRPQSEVSTEVTNSGTADTALQHCAVSGLNAQVQAKSGNV